MNASAMLHMFSHAYKKYFHYYDGILITGFMVQIFLKALYGDKLM